ncbi:putative nuclease HARBI1 [Rhipicephalus microplus]|uniref:putative nuclease HARBI1 n=1 Tax=Rhipicephalus microplus TaxID=6941 RepID=UPI003F6BF191
MADYASFVDYDFCVDDLFGDVEDCVSIPRQQLRDWLNPMEHFTDSEFLARYRFTKSSVKKLLECLPFEKSCRNRGHPLLPVMQLVITLRFYEAGTFQVVMGDLVNASQPTVSRVIERVSRLIAKHLFPAAVNFSNSDDRFRETMVEFYRIAKFPGVTGCIDCTHVRIKSPGGPNGEVYCNRKGYFYINVQVTCSFFAANVESFAVLLKCSNSTLTLHKAFHELHISKKKTSW